MILVVIFGLLRLRSTISPSEILPPDLWLWLCSFCLLQRIADHHDRLGAADLRFLLMNVHLGCLMILGWPHSETFPGASPSSGPTAAYSPVCFDLEICSPGTSSRMMTTRTYPQWHKYHLSECCNIASANDTISHYDNLAGLTPNVHLNVRYSALDFSTIALFLHSPTQMRHPYLSASPGLK